MGPHTCEGWEVVVQIKPFRRFECLIGSSLVDKSSGREGQPERSGQHMVGQTRLLKQLLMERVLMPAFQANGTPEPERIFKSWQTLSLKGQTANSFGLMGHTTSAAATHLYHCLIIKVALDIADKWICLCPNKTLFTKQVAGGIWLVAMIC